MAKKHRHPHIDFLRGWRRSKRRILAKPRRLLIGTGLGIAALGVIYVAILWSGFYAVKLHITDVAGVVDPNNGKYAALSKSLLNIPIDQLHLPSVDTHDEGLRKQAAAQDACQLRVIQQAWPMNGARIAAAQTAGATHEILAKMAFAVRLRDTGDTALSAALDGCLTDAASMPPDTISRHDINAFPWANREEWSTASAGFTKDTKVIQRAATTTSIDARMIVAAGFVEQMRLYFTQREVYEKFFRPLKILGNATQFAWGVMSIKEAAAIDVENHLHDTHSAFYLGPNQERALNFTTSDPAAERLARLTNEKDHLYSYLYGGFELAQYIHQWDRAGFPIDSRPEILATLYNIGFGHSKPNANPQVGGSTLTIADTQYTFGSLAFEFYYSGELMDVFPYSVPPS